MLKLKRSLSQDDKSFFGGTLAALDVVYLHNDPECVIAVEIVNACGADDLKWFAGSAECGYHQMDKLKRTVAELNRRVTQ